MNKLIAIVGMSGSGKSIATDYLEQDGIGIKINSISDVLYSLLLRQLTY